MHALLISAHFPTMEHTISLIYYFLALVGRITAPLLYSAAVENAGGQPRALLNDRVVDGADAAATVPVGTALIVVLVLLIVKGSYDWAGVLFIPWMILTCLLL